MTSKIIALFIGFLCHPSFGWTVLGASLGGWTQSPLVFGVNTANCTITDEELFTAVDTAINAWNGIAGSRLAIARADSTTTVADLLANTAGDVPVILCDPNLSASLGTDAENIPGATVRVAGSSNISYGGILLNAEAGKSSEISNLETGALHITLAHEIGHALGLGHSSISEALMYFSINSKTEVLIGEDDRDGIRFLYPRNEFETGIYGCAAIKKPSSRPGNSFWLFLSYFTLLFILPRTHRLLFRKAQS